MATVDLVIKNTSVLTPSGLVKAGIAVNDEKIVAIASDASLPAADKVINASGKIVIPGFIDTHVHFREPGFTYKEDFETGSKAAAAGGVTTYIAMPNTSPPPKTRELFLAQNALGKKKSVVDFNSWGMPTVLEEIPKIAKAGAIGFKFFTKVDVGETLYRSDIAIVDHGVQLETFREIAKTGLPVLVHPHNQFIWEYKVKKYEKEKKTLAKHFTEVTYDDADVMETTGIATLILLANAVGAKIRILHIQGIPQLRLIRAFKAAGYYVIAEQNPWAVYKVGALGLQSPKDVAENWKALNDGTIDVIATDHAPHTKEETEKGLTDVFHSVIIGYPLVEHYMAMYLTGVNKGKLSLLRLSQLASENAAKQVNIYPRKGVIQVGSDADLAIVDMKQERTLGKDYRVYSKIGYTPLQGTKVKGIPVCTIVRGTVVMEDGEVIGKPGYGEVITPLK